MENARLYGDLQDTFQQTIHGLASAIDKMDRYTAGHSERDADPRADQHQAHLQPLGRHQFVHQARSHESTRQCRPALQQHLVDVALRQQFQHRSGTYAPVVLLDQRHLGTGMLQRLPRGLVTVSRQDQHSARQ